MPSRFAAAAVSRADLVIESVPEVPEVKTSAYRTLAPLLRDPNTAEAARYALQPIPGPEAAAALREALGSLSGKAKAGLIGTIAHRGDTTVRAVLAGIKENPSEDAVVRDAAARALAHLVQA